MAGHSPEETPISVCGLKWIDRSYDSSLCHFSTYVEVAQTGRQINLTKIAKV
jgi:hypothetical protein